MSRAARPAAGGGRWVEVEAERLDGWLARFAARHGALAATATPASVRYVASDGTVAEVEVPFPPLPGGGSLVAHVLAERRVGVLLVRLGGFAVGVFAGPRLVAAKVGSRPVHGRSAAGGWSQQRFARRREGQARVALQAAADVAARLLLPELDRLDAVVGGGDRRAVDTVLADPRLAALRPLVVPRLLEVPDPNRRLLERTPARFRGARIRVTEPPGEPG